MASVVSRWLLLSNIALKEWHHQLKQNIMKSKHLRSVVIVLSNCTHLITTYCFLYNTWLIFVQKKPLSRLTNEKLEINSGSQIIPMCLHLSKTFLSPNNFHIDKKLSIHETHGLALMRVLAT